MTLIRHRAGPVDSDKLQRCKYCPNVLAFDTKAFPVGTAVIHDPEPEGVDRLYAGSETEGTPCFDLWRCPTCNGYPCNHTPETFAPRTHG